nr:MAG TPA: hypothetical protein [Caudoviricetes sp.]
MTVKGCITVNRLGSPPHLTPPNFPFTYGVPKRFQKPQTQL